MLSFSSIGEEGFCREIFEEYVSQLKDQEKENEWKRKEEKVWNNFKCLYAMFKTWNVFIFPLDIFLWKYIK